LAAHEPFVVTFATPRFCTSRTCGPVVDVVDYVRRNSAGSGVRFIHVEVFTKNRPALGYNRWMRQWGLQSEPWTFLVGRDGLVKAKFEGSVSAAELEAAIRRLILYLRRVRLPAAELSSSFIAESAQHFQRLRLLLSPDRAAA
jgi:hypothetical protein